MSDPALFSVVIPNWNGLHHLPTCLDALRDQTYPRLEVIVADNASADGSRDLLAAQYPEVRVIALPKNRGFTWACNAGMGAAQGADTTPNRSPRTNAPSRPRAFGSRSPSDGIGMVMTPMR